MPETSLTPAAESPSRFEQMKSMSLLEHLEELRRRLMYSIIGVLVCMGACWFFVKDIYNIMQRPIVDVLQAHHLEATLVYTNPVDPFNLYIKIGFIAGIFVASPFVLYQLWLFISPGLYRHEKRYVLPFMASTVGLFLMGGFFGYRFVYPRALDFLVSYGDQFRPLITINEYTSLFMTVVLGLGVVFELPILIFFLALMGIVSAGWLWRNFRYGILAIFIFAGAVAPTPDVLTMCIFAAPMIGLYLASIGVAWLVHPKQRKRRREAAAAAAKS